MKQGAIGRIVVLVLSMTLVVAYCTSSFTG